MTKATMSMYISIGFMTWGAWVDAQGLPVFDQVLLATIFGAIAIYHSDKEKP